MTVKKYSAESNEQWARRVVAEQDEAMLQRREARTEGIVMLVATLCVAAAVIFAYAAGITWRDFQ